MEDEDNTVNKQMEKRQTIQTLFMFTVELDMQLKAEVQ
jgi:hypothetical protein